MSQIVDDRVQRFLESLDVVPATQRTPTRSGPVSEPEQGKAPSSIVDADTQAVLGLLGKKLIPPDYSVAAEQLSLSRARLNKHVAHLEDLGLLVSFRLATKRRGGQRRIVLPSDAGRRYLLDHNLGAERLVCLNSSSLHNAAAKAEGENHLRHGADEVTYEHTVRAGGSSGLVRADIRIKQDGKITYSQVCLSDPVREADAAHRLIQSTHESFGIRLIGKDQKFLVRLERELEQQKIAIQKTPRLELLTTGEVLDRYYRKESP